jgi:hypothetical protein
MFLKLSDTPREAWKLVREEEGSRLRFESVDPSNTDPWIRTPVTLNPVFELYRPGKQADLSCTKRMDQFGGLMTTERVLIMARSVGAHSSLLDTYISDPPCKIAFVSVLFVPVGPSRMTTTGNHLHSLSGSELKVHSETGLKLSDLWDAGLDYRGHFWSTCERGFESCRNVDRLRTVLAEMESPSIALKTPWVFRVADVVVPTDEEWADVRQRDAQR